MRKVVAFVLISLDGYFADAQGDMSWAHKTDAEWRDFSESNAGGDGVLLMGRVTYELMIQFWPTPMAKQMNPKVAEGMNSAKKIVFSTTLKEPMWENTEVVGGDIVEAVRRMKSEAGGGMCVLGSGTIVSQLLDAGLIDELQMVISPTVLGAGRSPFAGVKTRRGLKLTKSRQFTNGNMVMWYEPEN